MKKQKQPKPSTKRFIVWGPTGTTNPRYVFDTEEAAENAASNMVQKHNSVFCVVEIKRVLRPTVITDTDVSSYFSTGNEAYEPIPF